MFSRCHAPMKHSSNHIQHRIHMLTRNRCTLMFDTPWKRTPRMAHIMTNWCTKILSRCFGPSVYRP